MSSALKSFICSLPDTSVYRVAIAIKVILIACVVLHFKKLHNEKPNTVFNFIIRTETQHRIPTVCGVMVFIYYNEYRDSVNLTMCVLQKILK